MQLRHVQIKLIGVVFTNVVAEHEDQAAVTNGCLVIFDGIYNLGPRSIGVRSRELFRPITLNFSSSIVDVVSI